MMTDPAIDRTADWLNGSQPTEPDTQPATWACVEIFGHRKHYGRISEVEKFGAKFLRVDVPGMAAAPLLGEAETFTTFVYGGSAIFSVTPMTEEACRKWAEHERPKPMSEYRALPRPSYDADDDDDEGRF
jgi:hypothetical protein